MAANCADWDVLCTQAKTILDTVTGIGLVEARPGGVVTWIKRRRPIQAFWEIDVASCEEVFAAIGTTAFEHPVIRIEGFMPWSYENPNSADTWRALVKAVRDALRTYPTLGNPADADGIRVAGLPSVRINERVAVEDGNESVLCHHVTIEMRADRYFTYSTSATI